MTPRTGLAESPSLFGRIESQIGARLRLRRVALGLRVEDVADALSVGPLELERMEAGHRHIDAPHLATLATLLAVPISYFFLDDPPATLRDGLDRSTRPMQPMGMRDSSGAEIGDWRAVLELLHAHDRINDPDLRRWVVELLQRAVTQAASIRRN